MLSRPVRAARSARRVRRLFSRLLPLAIVASALAAVSPPASAAPGTCTIFWKGTTSTAWETTTNWSLTDGGANAGRLPTVTDVACKSTLPTRTDVVITTTNRAVAGINFATGSLTLNAANLTVGSVASGAFDSTIRNLADSGNTLGGTAVMTLTGPGDPVTPVNLVLAGTGPVSIGPGSALNYSALIVNNGKTLTNNGTLTVSCANMALNLGAKLDNFGTITIPPSCGGFTPFLSDGNVNARFTNGPTGVMNVAGTSFVDMSAIAWHNNGAVNAAVTDFYFKPTAADTGTYNLAAGTTLHQYGPVTISPGTVTGAGTWRSDVGQTMIGNGGSVPHLSVPSGTISGSLTSPDAIMTSATFTGSGTFTVPSGGHAEMTGATVNDTYTLLNNGSLTSTCGFISLNGTTKLDNFGTTDLTSNVGCGSSTSIGGPVTSQVVNEPGGVLNLSATTFVDLSGVILHNNGQVNASSTDAYVHPTALDTGSYNIVSGHLNNFGDLTVSPGTVTGAGLFQQNGGGTLTGAGGNIPHLNAASGTVTGNLSSDDVTLNGAQLTGPGRLTVNTGGTLGTPGGVTLFGGYDIENHGTATLTTVNFADPNSILDNFGVLLLGSGSQIFDSSADASGQLINRAAGTITATCALATQSVFLQRLSNSGTLETNKCDLTLAAESDLSVAGALIGGGSFKASTGIIRFDNNIVSNAATLVLGATGSVFNNVSATALATLASNTGTLVLNKTVNTTTAFANSGTVNVQAATFRPNTYTQTAGSTVVVSTAALRGGVAGTGAVNINGGNLTGGGSIQAPLTVAGVIQPGGQGTAMAVTGTYAQTGAAIFGETITGPTTPGTDFAKLVVSSTASLNGTLAITTAPSYDPTVGTTFRILDASARSGTFSSVTGIALPNNKYYNVVYDATGVSLVVVADPVASVGNVSTSEGNSGTTTVNLPITLDQASARTVSYDYTTVDQTANAGSDYVAASGTLTFTPGQVSQNVTVTINGDTTFEPDETFLLRLSNPVNGTIGTNDGVGTITNDDSSVLPPSVTSVSPNTVGQGAVARPLTISGSDFGPSSVVTFNKAGITVVPGSQVVVDANTITLKIKVTVPTPLGATNVTVTVGALSNTCTGCLTVTPKPTVTSATPSSLGAGAVRREVTIHGTAFVPGAKVTIAGATVISTSFVDANTVEVLATVAQTRAPGNAAITLVNPDAGQSSCTCFAYTAGPKVTSVSPTSYARGTTVTITLTGTGFVPGAKVTGPTGIVFDAVVVTSPTSITAEASTASTAPLGTGKSVTVTNPAAGGYGVFTFKGIVITN